MSKIGIKTHTDKIYTNRYDRYYPMFLEHLRGHPIRMLDIGIFHSFIHCQFIFTLALGYDKGESYHMWREYFIERKSEIYYMDKNALNVSHPHSLWGIIGDAGYFC